MTSDGLLFDVLNYFKIRKDCMIFCATLQHKTRVPELMRSTVQERTTDKNVGISCYRVSERVGLRGDNSSILETLPFFI